MLPSYAPQSLRNLYNKRVLSKPSFAYLEDELVKIGLASDQSASSTPGGIGAASPAAPPLAAPARTPYEPYDPYVGSSSQPQAHVQAPQSYGTTPAPLPPSVLPPPGACSQPQPCEHSVWMTGCLHHPDAP